MQFWFDICYCLLTILLKNLPLLLYFPPSNYIKMHATLQHEMSRLFTSEPISALGCGIYRQDFQSLHEGQWLRSQSIAFLCAILQKDYPKLFSNPPSLLPQTQPSLIKLNLAACKILNPSVSSMLLFMGSEPYILQSMEGQNLFSYRYLLIPANTETRIQGRGSHWFLMIYDTLFHRMWTMDSTFEFVHANAQLMGERLSEMRKIFKVEERNRKICELILNSCELTQQQRKIEAQITQKKEFQVVAVKNTIKQRNNYDCGVHLVGNIELFLRYLENCTSTPEESSLNFIQRACNLNVSPMQLVGDSEFFRDLRIRYYSRAFDVLTATQTQKD